MRGSDGTGRQGGVQREAAKFFRSRRRGKVRSPW